MTSSQSIQPTTQDSNGPLRSPWLPTRLAASASTKDTSMWSSADNSFVNTLRNPRSCKRAWDFWRMDIFFLSSFQILGGRKNCNVSEGMRRQHVRVAGHNHIRPRYLI